MISQTAEDQEVLQKNLISVDFGEKVNTANDIREGAYKKYMYEIDLWNGTVMNFPPFDFLNEFDTEYQEAVHTRQFIDDVVGDRYRRFILKDWASANIQAGPEVRNNTYMTDLYARKNTFMYHYRQNSINVSAYGDNRVVAGSIIYLDLRSRDVNEDPYEPDKERSGPYFVESVENVFYKTTYIQNMTLSRYANGDFDISALPTQTTPVIGPQ